MLGSAPSVWDTSAMAPLYVSTAIGSKRAARGRHASTEAEYANRGYCPRLAVAHRELQQEGVLARGPSRL